MMELTTANNAFQERENTEIPLNETTQQDFLSNMYGVLAEHSAITNLLNCYIREYAIAANEVSFNAHIGDAPLVLCRADSQSQLVLLSFPQSLARILICADRISLLGRCHFTTFPYLKGQGNSWRRMSARELCQFLLQHLAKCLDSDFNDELLEQVDNSILATQAFLIRRSCRETFTDTFLRAEQNLVWGHAMHPAPKSRHGVAMDDMLSCSPEIFSSFPLYWFRVAPDLIEVQGNSGWLLNELLSTLHGKDDILYPCHPWEVYNIMRQPLVRQAIAEGRITPVGLIGQKIAPTSSVRTLYHPDLAAQLKFSINVRLTNCVRKNAWYELESAVVLSRLLAPLQKTTKKYFPQFEFMPEPMATTLKLNDIDCRESFGILYRDNISKEKHLKYSPSLAASIFSLDGEGKSVLVKNIMSLCRSKNCDYETMTTTWLTHYINCLMPGILYYFFRYGVVFEPHLQNVLIGFEDGVPSFAWVRDLEGTKLLPEKWPSGQLGELSERARESIYYCREKGWNRIAYCLLINNFSEAIFHAARGDQKFELRLWQILSEQIERWQLRYGVEPELNLLLRGAPIPSKNNFTARLLKQADRSCSYMFLHNPMVNV